ncbi:hypothetical protein TRFO_09949 [Tritrichomonas foetus]|uniref:Uncharacterized protein n=1 Tax=Tritrichomonas foetus TaxID=1144522 RepID=A0A1J4JF96_9EUKA|nr:hypothetical protein TRFO_09949 [Tritrichomonas foetus]|eukprot:OHS96323.1 hypothetical protein TRFO_09949 [Tritrichomonas foetus]
MSEISYDSITRKESSTSETEDDVYIFQRRLTVVKNFSHLLMFILFFLAIVIPWWITRDESLKSFKFLSAERVTMSSQGFANATQNLMMKYEIASELLASIASDPSICSCSREHIFNFIKFGETMNEVLSPRPYRFYLGNNYTASCQLEFDENDKKKFKLYMVFPYNETIDQVRIFNETENFQNGDFDMFNGGIFERFISQDESGFRYTVMHNQGYWSSSLALFGGQDDPRTMTSFYPVNFEPNDAPATLCGVTILNTDLVSVYQELPSPENSRWLLLDENLRMIIDREHGALYPDSIESLNPTYPYVENASNELWREASQYIDDLEDGKILLIVINDSVYHMIRRSIRTKAKLTFNFIMLFGLENFTLKVIIPTTHIIIGIIVVLGVVIFLISFIQIQNKHKRDSKLAKPLISEEVERILNSGSIGEVIYGLRQLEMSTPEEIMMNKVVDSVVCNIAKPSNRLFSVSTNTQTKTCEFCRFLKPEIIKKSHYSTSNSTYSSTLPSNTNLNNNNSNNNIDDSFQHNYEQVIRFENNNIEKYNYNFYRNCEINHQNNLTVPDKDDKNNEADPYYTWKNLTFERMKKDIQMKSSRNLSIHIDKCIVYKFIEFLNDKQLFFIEFDPDKLIEFAIFFTKKMNKNPYKTLESINLLNQLFLHDFGQWIVNKLDMFALIFSVLIRDIENFSIQEQQKLLKCDDKEFLLNDSVSRGLRTMKIVKILLNSFIPINQNDTKSDNNNHTGEMPSDIKTDSNNAVFSYFMNRVETLFQSCEIAYHFEIYGEFKNRIESPEFSATNNPDDLILFMKSIFVFLDYSRYFTEEDTFDNVFEELNKILFTEEEKSKDHFVWSYHFEILDKFVSPYAFVLSNLVHIEWLHERLLSNTENILKKLNGVSNHAESLCESEDNSEHAYLYSDSESADFDSESDPSTDSEM